MDGEQGRNKEKQALINWYSQAKGMQAEEQVFRMLVNKFYNDTCLLLPGYKGNDLKKIEAAVIQSIGESFKYVFRCESISTSWP